MDIWRTHLGIEFAYLHHLDPHMNSINQVLYKGTPYQINMTAPVASGPVLGCVDGMFMCHDQTCILDVEMCDGDYDCVDKSDEIQCEAICTYIGAPQNVSDYIHGDRGGGEDY